MIVADERKMNVQKVHEILRTNDGSLPDIDFDFGQAGVVGEAYPLIQKRASSLASGNAYYWSNSKNQEVPIQFGDNPACECLTGDADAFHVVFAGLQSISGAPVPDLGVFVFGASSIALDYRMGPEWDEHAIVGLFEIMRDLIALDDRVKISHSGNVFDPDGRKFLTQFEHWLEACNLHERTGRSDAPR